MQQRLLLIFFISFLFLVTQACDDMISGDYHENQPPRTFLSVENVDLPEDERLASRVDLQWWGDDPDGYVVAYEYCIGDDECDPADTESENWNYTKTTDTTMVLPIPPGDDVADVTFNVRAIDNEDLRDPEGASITFPIENTPPEIRFDPTETPPDTTYTFASFGFQASDPDGDEDLNYYEVAINDTTNGEWVRIDREISFITLDIIQEDVGSDSTVSANLLTGRALNDSSEELEGIQLDARNTLYLRALDQSLDQSEVAEYEWHVLPQQSDVLLLNDQAGTAHVERSVELMEAAGISDVDIWDISDAPIPSGNVLPTPVTPTLNRALAKWDHIFWASNRLEHNLQFAVEALGEFLNEGGTLFINAPSIPVSEQNEESVFSILPTSGFESTPAGQQRFTIGPGADISPRIAKLETLRTGGGSASMRPMTEEGGSTSLYDADFDTDEEDISKLISAINSDQNVLYFGFRVNNVEGPVEDTMNYFLNDMLEFESH